MDDKKKPGRGNSPASRKNLKPIQKGEVRNPEGGRAHDPVSKELRKFTSEYLGEVIEVCVMGDLDALEKMSQDRSLPAIKVGVARVLFKAVNDGDWNKVELILARIIGKVPDKVDATSNGKTIGRALTLKFVDDGLPE